MARSNEFPVEPRWRALLEDLGVRPANVLRRARLPEDLLTQADARLGTEEYFRFWAGLEAEIGDPMFPVRLVEAATAEVFLPPLFAALCSPNLIVGAERISRYKRLVAPMALHVEGRRDTLSLTFEWLDATSAPPRSLVAMELAFLVRLARLATREPVRPWKVTAPLPPEPAREYERYFGVPVQRGRAASLVFSREDAERPFLTANESMWNLFEPELRRRLAELDADATVADRVRAVLLESLPSGQASMEEVASRLALSKRTLQRRLGAEGTSYQAQLNQTRESLARHYLAKTELTCTEISFLLGYEEPNSFFRAFHDWTGDTPERVRQAVQ